MVNESIIQVTRSDTEEVQRITTYREYEFNFNNNALTGRILEGKEVLKMWIYKAVFIPRYVYPIYFQNSPISTYSLSSINENIEIQAI